MSLPADLLDYILSFLECSTHYLCGRAFRSLNLKRRIRDLRGRAQISFLYDTAPFYKPSKAEITQNGVILFTKAMNAMDWRRARFFWRTEYSSYLVWHLENFSETTSYEKWCFAMTIDPSKIRRSARLLEWAIKSGRAAPMPKRLFLDNTYSIEVLHYLLMEKPLGVTFSCKDKDSLIQIVSKDGTAALLESLYRELGGN